MPHFIIESLVNMTLVMSGLIGGGYHEVPEPETVGEISAVTFEAPEADEEPPLFVAEDSPLFNCALHGNQTCGTHVQVACADGTTYDGGSTRIAREMSSRGVLCVTNVAAGYWSVQCDGLRYDGPSVLSAAYVMAEGTGCTVD